MAYANKIDSMAGEIYRYLNFDQMDNYVAKASTVIPTVEA
jgi:aconitate hydratase 2/2-methylisocitrate dehydratase